MLYYYCYVKNWLEEKLQPEKGIETVEWIALAAVILVLLAALLSVVKVMGKPLGYLIFAAITSWVAKWF